MVAPERRYRQLTVRLWGKGVVLRDEVLGGEISRGMRRYVARAGEFVLSRIDARNGALGLVPAELDGAIVSNDFPVFQVNRDKLFSEYLGWLSRTRGFVDLCRRSSEGSTNRIRLREELFLIAEIPLPTLTEQSRIVARIDYIAENIDEARRLRASAKLETQSFLSSLHLQLARDRRVKLGDVLTLDEHREIVLPGRSYPQVGVRGFGQGLFRKEAIEQAGTTYRWFNRLYDGAVVLSQVKGWEGAVAVCPPDLAGAYVSPEYRTFRCLPDQAEPQYLAALVTTPWFWQQLKSLDRGVGARRGRTRPEQFVQLEIPMPALARQQQVVPLLQRLVSLKRLQNEVEMELEALLPTVLERAFGGVEDPAFTRV